MPSRGTAPSSGLTPRKKAHSSGFTLLEVLVAVAVLGLGLTVVLGSQVGLFSSANQVEHLTYATNLARCKMNETSVDLLKKGYPLVDENDEGECCEGEETTIYRCTWSIQRVELPQPIEIGDSMGADAGMDFGDSVGSMGPLGALNKITQSDGQALGDKPDVNALAGFMGEGASAGMEGIVPMLMSLVYPMLKPMLEASIRKVTVKVLWREGRRDKELEVIQYVTNPQQGGLDQILSGELSPDAAGGLGTAPTGTAPGTGTTPTPRTGAADGP